MSKSPNIGLTLTPASEDTKNFKDFRTELAGDSSDSNMMILDTEIGDVKSRCDGFDTDIDNVNERCDSLDTEIGDVKSRCDELDTEPISWGMLKNGFGYSSSS